MKRWILRKGRLDQQEEHQVIQSYMAHHQGMILTAIHNYLNDNAVKKCHGYTMMQTVNMLLQESISDGAGIG